jgi:hypothetical protein
MQKALEVHVPPSNNVSSLQVVHFVGLTQLKVVHGLCHLQEHVGLLVGLLDHFLAAQLSEFIGDLVEEVCVCVCVCMYIYIYTRTRVVVI